MQKDSDVLIELLVHTPQIHTVIFPDTKRPDFEQLQALGRNRSLRCIFFKKERMLDPWDERAEWYTMDEVGTPQDLIYGRLGNVHWERPSRLPRSRIPLLGVYECFLAQDLAIRRGEHTSWEARVSSARGNGESRTIPAMS